MIATVTDNPGDLFVDANLWADMDAWHARVTEIRRHQPMLHVDMAGFDPFWVLTRHADIFAIERDDAHWVNTPWSVLGPKAQMEEAVASGMPLPASLVQLDGEKHRKHRQVANDQFKPAAVGRRQPRINEIADEFVAKMRSMGGQCDFASDIAAPFTLRVVMDIYGVPPEDEPMMLELTQGIFGANDPEFLGDAADPQARVVGSIMKFLQYFNEITADRQACPRDDLASIIANAEIDGCPIGDVERIWYYIIVATAGHDTTSFAIAGGMEALLHDIDQLWAIRDEPELINNATDEIIRWTTPVRHFLRYATDDSEVNGVHIPAGGRVLLSYPSANRDEEVFDDPFTFDIRRPDADRLLSFGIGAHYCLGAQFARREVRTLIGRLAQELDHIELAGEAQWSLSHFVSGVKHLPVAYSFR